MPFSTTSPSTGGSGTPGPQGEPGPAGQYPNYLGEYNNGVSYPIGGIVSIPVGSPYGNPGQLFIRSSNSGNPGYPPGTSSWTLYTNGLVVAGIPAFLPLTASNGAGNYLVPYGYFNYGAYGTSIAIARTPQVDAYMNYAISTGVPQTWVFKHFQNSETDLTFVIELGVPTLNVEINGTGKEIWTLLYDASEWNSTQSGLAATYPSATFNGTEYGLFLAKTGALVQNVVLPPGANGTFANHLNEMITVTNGIITSIGPT